MAPEADWNLEMVRSREARRCSLSCPERGPSTGAASASPTLTPASPGTRPSVSGRARHPGSGRPTASTCSRSASRATPSTTTATPATAPAPAASCAARPCCCRARTRSAARSASHPGCRWCPAGSSGVWCCWARTDGGPWLRGSGTPSPRAARWSASASASRPSAPWAKGGMGLVVDEAYEAGVIVVAAGGQFIDSLCYPAKFNRTIGVGGGRDPAAGRGRRPRLVEPEREARQRKPEPAQRQVREGGRDLLRDGPRRGRGGDLAARATSPSRASTTSRGSGSRRSAACCARPPGGSRASSRRTVTPASSTSRPCLRLTSRRGASSRRPWRTGTRPRKPIMRLRALRACLSPSEALDGPRR